MKSLSLLMRKLDIQFLLNYMYIFGHAPNIVRVCFWHKESLTTKLLVPANFGHLLVLKGLVLYVPKNRKIVFHFCYLRIRVVFHLCMEQQNTL
jgi:hypothetical protein